MADLIECESLHADYWRIVSCVVTSGEPVAPRNMPTYELRDVTLTFEKPQHSLPMGCGRRLNPAIGIVEAMQLIAGVSRPDILQRITSNFDQFVVDGKQHGAYGPRAAWQMPKLISLLQSDPDTRQAIITVWDAKKDLAVSNPDIPCTLNLTFALRNGALYLTTHMRSNDVWWGLAYDVFQFTALQMTVARCLNVRPGTYTHIAGSLHIYERDVAAGQCLYAPQQSDVQAFTGVGDRAGIDWGSYATRANLILNRQLPYRATPHEAWAADIIKAIPPRKDEA